MLRPLYESSKVVAQRMTIAVSVDMTQSPLRRVSLFCQNNYLFLFRVLGVEICEASSA